MLLTDGGSDKAKEVFEKYNWPNNKSVSVEKNWTGSGDSELHNPGLCEIIKLVCTKIVLMLHTTHHIASAVVNPDSAPCKAETEKWNW